MTYIVRLKPYVSANSTTGTKKGEGGFDLSYPPKVIFYREDNNSHGKERAELGTGSYRTAINIADMPSACLSGCILPKALTT